MESQTTMLSVQVAMARLPADQRMAVSLVLIEGLPYREAAEVLDVPIGTLGVSFLAKSGEYCRTFSTRAEQPLSGLACRADGRWNIRALSQTDRVDGASSDFRTASSVMSPLILQLVEQQIEGEPLDAPGEMAARDKQWKADSRDQKMPSTP